jgi:fucose permease
MSAAGVDEEPVSFLPLCLAMFIGGVVVIATGPLLSPIMADLHVSLARGGFISMGFFLGRGLGGVALLMLLARVSIKRVLVMAYVVQAMALAAVGLLSSNLWSFFAMYAVVGIATAMPLSIPGMWVSAHVRSSTERAMTLVVAPFALATVITPWVVGALVGAGASWRWIFLGEAALSLVVALVATTFTLPDISGRENLRLRQVKEVSAFRPGLFGAILLAGLMYVGLESSFGVWLPKFQQSVFAVGPMSAGVAVTIFWTGQLIGRLGIVPLTRRMDPSRLVLWLGSFSVVLSVLVGLSPSHGFSLAAIFAVGLATSALWPLLSSYCSRFPRWHAGVMYSLMGLAGAVGSISFPYLIGPAAHTLGFRTAIALIAIPAAVGTLLAPYLRRVANRTSGTAPFEGGPLAAENTAAVEDGAQTEEARAVQPTPLSQ